MPNKLDATGLTVKTRDEILSSIITQYQTIYGPDINTDSDTPDGQQVNIYVQATLDQEDLAVQIYNSFDPDKAIGTVLDARIALNGVQRQAGTRTITNITVVTNRALNLNGDFDNLFPDQPIFVVSDNAGNQWQLINSQTIPGPGTYVFAFQSAKIGAVLTTPNTITIATTVVLGVVSVNNPTTYTSLGLKEETDAAVRLRRQQSVSINSQGFIPALEAALKNINGVDFAIVYENTTGNTDGDGIPDHSIWAIIDGGDNTSIANAIYRKRNGGCGMKGSVSQNITQPDGTLIAIKWDIVVAENLYIQFNAHSINGVDAIDTTGIKNYLVANFVSGINVTEDINHIATLVQQFDPNCLVTGAGLSKAALGPFTNTVNSTAKNNRFALLSGNIAITVI